MGRIFFISDTHFNHTNILKYEPDERFSTVEDRNEFIIENWNRVVKPEDKIYHLGDVFMGTITNYIPIHKRLAGKKRLIVGNHDRIVATCQQQLFQKVMLWKVFNDPPFLFTHVPVHPSTITERTGFDSGWNIHGHTHSNGSPEPQYRSVCVELNNYTPVEFDFLYEEWKKQ